jgi:hypothetical protein
MEQHLISNLLLIREFLLLNSVLEFVGQMVQVSAEIWKEQHVILHFLVTKEFEIAIQYFEKAIPETFQVLSYHTIRMVGKSLRGPWLFQMK